MESTGVWVPLFERPVVGVNFSGNTIHRAISPETIAVSFENYQQITTKQQSHVDKLLDQISNIVVLFDAIMLYDKDTKQ